MIKILFVCHGNICRSTMAQSIFTDIIKKEGSAESFFVDSAATSREEIGNPPHNGTKRKLAQEGIALIPHRARQMTRQDYETFDYLIGMDRANIANMTRIAGGDPEHKLYRLLDFTEQHRDVADPWFTGDFDATYVDVQSGCAGFLRYLYAKQDL